MEEEVKGAEENQSAQENTQAEAAENIGPKWYVVHTYSGYENKVKANIEKSIQNLHLEDTILDVEVPLEEVVEVKNGQRKTVQKKLFPGYVLVHMVMNDDTWYIVRNTRGVTGFVGPESKAVPLTDEEIANLGIRTEQVQVDYEVGDMVKVTSSSWENTVGRIISINLNKSNMSKSTVTIGVEMFGRETPVEVSIYDIKKL